jgi:hypothetical protein
LGQTFDDFERTDPAQLELPNSRGSTQIKLPFLK